MIELSERVKQVTQDLFDHWLKSKQNDSIALYTYTLEGRAENLLSELLNLANRQQRELDILKVQSETWKQSYLDQVKENVRYQAQQLAREAQ